MPSSDSFGAMAQIDALDSARQSAIGVSTPRRDSGPKVRGVARYAADVPVPGLLHARLLLSHEAHALIRSIDASAARALPGVAAVLTAADLPIVTHGRGRMYEPLAHEEVVYAGQPIAIVVAESEAIAADAVELIDVETETLEAALDLDAAYRPGAPRARVSTRTTGDDGSDVGDAHAAVAAAEASGGEELSENVIGSAALTDGDVDAALAGSEHVVRARFHTPWVYQGYLEPQSATAWFEPGGDLVVSSATQGAFFTRDQLAKLFGLSVDSVRIRAEPLGGAFGGKTMIVEPLVVGAALVLRRPVRLVMTRSEDFAACNPAAAEILEVEIGADRDGSLTGIRARILCDCGSSEFGMEPLAALLSAGPYRWQAYDLTAYGVLTNRVTQGAYRAPAAPQAAFALESLVDELAERLQLDPLELRLRNVLTAGDRTVAGGELTAFGARECLERIRDHPLWARRGELPADEGVGVAIGWWPGGLEPASAACRLDSDGQLTIVTGAADMTGVETAFAIVAAETFGLPLDRVRVVYADTASAPYAPLSGGSKMTYTVGRAVETAAREAREQLLEIAAAELEISPEDLEIVDGAVQPVGVPAKAVALERLAAKVLTFDGPYPPVEAVGRVSLPPAPQCAAHLSHVRVDRETGAVTVLGHVVAQDVGRALNPALVTGQMHGGVAQGLGWALMEELSYDEEGQPTSGSFVAYGMPSTGVVPPIDTEIVEVPAPEGPYGAKGVGEAPVVGVPGAVANAIAAAVGSRLRHLPMTSERVWRALADNGV